MDLRTFETQPDGFWQNYVGKITIISVKDATIIKSIELSEKFSM